MTTSGLINNLSKSPLSVVNFGAHVCQQDVSMPCDAVNSLCEVSCTFVKFCDLTNQTSQLNLLYDLVPVHYSY